MLPANLISESDSERQKYWESFFRAGEDRWQCDNPYETTKYEQTLALLPPGPILSALELACAEGHFTARLAPRVGRLMAADISPTAVQRARARCEGMANVTFQVIDLLRGNLPHDLDLLVCSEALYYTSRAELASLPERFAGALKPGGYLLMAHACTIADERERTGFDWDVVFGAKTIGDTFSASSFALKKELRTELYRIQLFQRTIPDHVPHLAAQIIEAARVASLPAYVEGAVIWGGAVITRAEARERERATEVPILMYHSIADDGPPELDRHRVCPRVFREHLRFLRRNGYHSVSLGEWARSIANGEALAGRPVIITFDDGYRNFIANALPLLEAADFRATIFIVAGKVGGVADWDTTSWPPLPLMDWDDLRELTRRGFEIGCHTTSHADLRVSSDEEILRDSREARAMLQEQLHLDVGSIALPWGRTDARIRVALARGGYCTAVTTERGRSSLADDPLHLPRIEITQNDDAESLSRLLEARDGAAIDRELQPRVAPDVCAELALLREHLRAAENETQTERGRAESAEGKLLEERRRAEFSETEASLQLETAGRCAKDQSDRADAAEEQLQLALIRLHKIESSTTWRATAPLRSWFSTRPRLARAARWSAKALWWSATLQLPGKVRERLSRRRAVRASSPSSTGAAEAETRADSAPTPSYLEQSPANVPEVGAPPPPTFASVASSLLSDIPVLICSFNNVTYLRGMVRQLRARGLSNIIIVDNASTAGETQDYLDAVAATTKVVRLRANLGPRDIFLSEAAYARLPDLFCVTDPDLEFNPDLPVDFLEELVELTERFHVGKAGFALDIANRDAMRDEMFEINGGNYRIWEWEEQFWQTEVGTTSGGDPVYRADIDTTFALYHKRYFKRSSPFDAVRAAGRFTCRHLPWYRDHGMPEAEAETYRATQKFSYYMRPSY
jgi:peptidoglycan/xylan/chitin deacetylase (PgdA/CDA1 family)